MMDPTQMAGMGAGAPGGAPPMMPFPAGRRRKRKGGRKRKGSKHRRGRRY